MTVIFSDFIENIIEVFMDEFSVYGGTFDLCLKNLTKVLRQCEEVNLMLNWEKCHFMVQEWVVLGHVISNRDIEVDKATMRLTSDCPLLLLQSGCGVSLFMRDFIVASSRISLRSPSL